MNDHLTSDSYSHVQILLPNIRPSVCVSLPAGNIFRAPGHCDPHHPCGGAINGRLGNCIRLVWILVDHRCECLQWPSLESYTSCNARQILGTRQPTVYDILVITIYSHHGGRD